MELPVKPKDILTPQDIFRLVDAATHPRDQAMVILGYEAAGRSKEILNLKISSIQLESDRAYVTLEGNTGARRILVVDSVPYLQTWLNVHPFKHNKGAYLFPALQGVHKGSRMNSHNFLKILKKLKREAKMEKPARPHLLRHARLTELAKHLTDAQLKNYAGWTQASRMTGVYVHLAGKDLDQPIMEMHGLAEKPKTTETFLKEKECVRGHGNEATAAYCKTCGIILDREQALQLQKEEGQQTEEIEDLKQQLKGLAKKLDRTEELVSMFSQALSRAQPDGTIGPLYFEKDGRVQSTQNVGMRKFMKKYYPGVLVPIHALKDMDLAKKIYNEFNEYMKKEFWDEEG